jgi:hypothetical protein
MAIYYDAGNKKHTMPYYPVGKYTCNGQTVWMSKTGLTKNRETGESWGHVWAWMGSLPTGLTVKGPGAKRINWECKCCGGSHCVERSPVVMKTGDELRTVIEVRCPDVHYGRV